MLGCYRPDCVIGRDICPRLILAAPEIHYETYGAGTPLLLVPGLGGIGQYWKPNIPALAERYQVIIHDHRGTGESSRSSIRYSVDQMTNDLIAIMDHLKLEKASSHWTFDRRGHRADAGGAAAGPS